MLLISDIVISLITKKSTKGHSSSSVGREIPLHHDFFKILVGLTLARIEEDRMQNYILEKGRTLERDRHHILLIVLLYLNCS